MLIQIDFYVEDLGKINNENVKLKTAKVETDTEE